MYSLSKEYVGHEQDVRSLVAHHRTLFSCSRDGTVREWDTTKDTQIEVQQYRTHQGFVNAIAYFQDHIISGGQDSVINVVKTGTAEPVFTLLGHTSNVCALDVCPDGSIISGSWDGTAKLWKDGACLNTMEGHEGAVWAVLYTEHGILTGGADRTIRLWRDGKQVKNYPAGKDCVRALALHPLGFVSAGNDAIIRLHTFEGLVVQELEGHESFIYNLATTAEGDIFSVAEDRTLRVWQNSKLMQSITLPAVSVWAVALLDNGDVATGSSDALVRVFTQAAERKATTSELKAFEDAVASSAIPAKATNIPNNLPGLEALAGPGKKEGEVKMIRVSPDMVEAHQWSGGVWSKIGEVMGASAKRVEHEGKEWDFVFDVDIAEGVPPLKLPYNTEENPYEAANRFIAKNGLDVGFQAQIVKFIETNTGGIPLGVPKTQTDTTSKTDVTSNSSLTPQLTMLSMTTGNSVPILKKLKEFVAATNMNDSLYVLDKLDTSKPSQEQIALLLQVIDSLPREQRFPALDLLRMCIPNVSAAEDVSRILPLVLQASEFKLETVNDKARETNNMLALRCLANLFTVKQGRSLLQTQADEIIEAVSAVHYPANRNLSLALSTFLLNASVTACQGKSTVDGINLIDPILRTIKDTTDSEILFRSLIALGTLLRISDDVVEAAKDVFEAGRALHVHANNKEERIRAALHEVHGLLK
ncbi:protein of unknown function [Taphrina deformans PYCC 5710]|uniref:Polyubiquitin binding protein n=1 Tax=Taphrina deformans (strain PYCC 5710 / ATCC 11124 / CBS 356.35 / IMI 108563 / JCM 9778 / NBRC 8474) TaxID=1097556 RepID=R4XGA2_TAPDE|nr:protein of unknown function [Taphrina deformans PYCC 5710]|eukprot:CCG84657.1 protein of unknown function [Taphrina deformans PYCC 5710]